MINADRDMKSTPTREDHQLIREMVRRAKPGSVLVLAALDHSSLAEEFCKGAPHVGASITVLSLDEGLDYLLERSGSQFISLRKLVPPGIYAGMDKLAEEMAGRWNWLHGGDITEFEGVSYASLVQWEMTYYFARVMKSVLDAQAVTCAGLGNTFFIPVRPSLQAMILFRDRAIMGDPPESLFAEALSYMGKDHMRVERLLLPATSAWRPNRPNYRMLISQIIQRWIMRLVLHTLPKRCVYVQDEYYLGPELTRVLAADGQYQVVHESPGRLRQCLQAIREHGVLHIPPNWFGRTAAGGARRRAAAQFFGGAESPVTGVRSNRSLLFRDVDLGPLVERKLSFLFEQRFPELAAEQEQVRSWVKATRICSTVLLEEVMQWSRQVITGGRLEGITSVCVQHGVTGYDDDVMPHVGFIPVAADVTAVWGEIARTWLRTAGVPEEQIAVVGCPRFDRYPQEAPPPVSEEDRQAFFAHLGIPPTKHFVLYAETGAIPYLFPKYPGFHDTSANLEILLTTMRRLPGCHLGIRLRYGANDPYAVLYQDIINYSMCDNVSFLPQLPLTELLPYSEFTVVSSSGIAIEALYYDHPLIVVDLTGYHRIMPIVEYGAGVLVNSPEEFVEFVRRYNVDASMRAELRRGRARLLNDEVASRDGGASRRVVELLDYLISHGAAATRAAIKEGRGVVKARTVWGSEAVPAGSDRKGDDVTRA